MLKDVQTIQALGSKISGIIIGKALYEGTLDLKEALAMVASAGEPRTSC